MSEILYSRGSGTKDAHPQNRRAGDWPAFVSIILNDRGTAKGQQYIAAPFHNGHRSKNSAQARMWIGLDVDGCTPAEFTTLRQRLEGLRAVAYTTASHTAAHPRCRVIVALCWPADRESARSTSEHLRGQLGDGLALKWDASCDRAEQPLFLPLVDAQTWQFGGAPLIPRPAPVAPHVAVSMTSIAPAHPLACRAAEMELKRFLADISTAPPGNRNNLINGGSWSMGTYVGAGRLDRADTLRTILGAVAAAGWDDLDKTRRTVESAISGGTREPATIHIPDLSTSTASTSGGGLVLRSAADIQPEAIHWIWNGWLAAGKLHILAGPGGCGKTTIAASLAATITTGGKWPDGSSAATGDVLMWSGEDDAATTLVPRFIACGANLARVHFASGVIENGTQTAFNPAKHLPQLRAQLEAGLRIKLLIVDSIVSAIGSADSHKNAEVRQALEPLVYLAERHDFAIIGITHLTKGTQGRDPTERITGSLAFGALARVVLVAAKSEASEDKKANYAFARSKSNIGPDYGGFAYDLRRIAVGSGVEGQRVDWGDVLDGTTREVLASLENNESGSDTDDWLRNLLERRPTGIMVNEIFAAGRISGFSVDKLKRAKKRLKVSSQKFQDGWIWLLPGVDAGLPASPSIEIPAPAGQGSTPREQIS